MDSDKVVLFPVLLVALKNSLRKYNTHIALLVLALIPVALFLCFFTPQVLYPTNIGWLFRSDWGQHFLGWEALRNSPIVWPYNHESLLAYPTGLSVVYTDSNPLLALPLRFLNSYLPANFQYIGPWFFLCVALQVFIAFMLLRRHAPGVWSAVVGATLLTLLPTLYNRILHDTLFAHWVLLWAIYIFFEVRSERGKFFCYSAMLAVTALIHPYLLLMVSAIWAADQIRILGVPFRTRNFRKAWIVVGSGVLCLLPMVASVAISGVFTSGQEISRSGFRYYSMGLDALFNPARRDFTLAFLRGPQGDGEVFEGFQYLGAGLLFLIGAAFWVYRRNRTTSANNDTIEMARPLLWPFIGLLALALTDHVQIYGHRIFGLPLPNRVLDLLSVVRSSGRLFWPIAYVGVFLSLTAVYKSKLSTRVTILAVALALQLVDIAPFAKSIRHETAEAAERKIILYTPSPQWDTLVSHATAVEFEPQRPSNDEKSRFYEIIWRAISDHVPVTSMYAARQSAAQILIEEKEDADFNKGVINSGWLYILLDKCQVPQDIRPRVRLLDGLWVIPPLSEQGIVTDAPAVQSYQADNNCTN